MSSAGRRGGAWGSSTDRRRTAVADTGPLPSSGGAQEASLLDVPAVSLGSVGALNGADVAHAATIGQGNGSQSQASVADLSLTLAGNTIAADFLMSGATAHCNGATPWASGSSELADLVIKLVPATRTRA